MEDQTEKVQIEIKQDEQILEGIFGASLPLKLIPPPLTSTSRRQTSTHLLRRCPPKIAGNIRSLPNIRTITPTSTQAYQQI
jgi:hypothetical protein